MRRQFAVARPWNARRLLDRAAPPDECLSLNYDGLPVAGRLRRDVYGHVQGFRGRFDVTAAFFLPGRVDLTP